MTRKILYFLCACYIFVFCAAKADVIHELNIVKINGIAMYGVYANGIIRDTRERNIDIFDAKDGSIMVDIDTETKGLSITIDSKLMDEVARLYDKVVSDDSDDDIVLIRSEGNEIIIIANKEKGLITSVVVSNYDSQGIIDSILMDDEYEYDSI